MSERAGELRFQISDRVGDWCRVHRQADATREYRLDGPPASGRSYALALGLADVFGRAVSWDTDADPQLVLAAVVSILCERGTVADGELADAARRACDTGPLFPDLPAITGFTTDVVREP